MLPRLLLSRERFEPIITTPLLRLRLLLLLLLPPGRQVGIPLPPTALAVFEVYVAKQVGGGFCG